MGEKSEGRGSGGKEGTNLHRVQRTGRSSLSVTLPKAWTTSMNIHGGDTVAFRNRGDGTLELAVSPLGEEEEGTQKRLVINATGADPNLVSRMIVGAYITGQDRVVVTNLPAECRKRMEEIDRTIKHMVGLSMVTDAPDRLEFQIFLDPSKYRLPALLGRMSQMLHMVVESLQRALEEASARPLGQLPAIEDEIDRFYFLIARQILLSSNDFRIARSIGVPSHHFQMGYRMVAKMFEVVGDLLNSLAQDLRPGLEKGGTLTPEARQQLSHMIGQFDGLMERTVRALSGPNIHEASDVLDAIEETIRETSASGGRLIRSVRGKDVALEIQQVVLRLMTGLAMLKIVNEIAINRGVEPEMVSSNGGSPNPQERSRKR